MWDDEETITLTDVVLAATPKNKIIPQYLLFWNNIHLSSDGWDRVKKKSYEFKTNERPPKRDLIIDRYKWQIA